MKKEKIFEDLLRGVLWEGMSMLNETLSRNAY